jgi:hypothetical protein
MYQKLFQITLVLFFVVVTIVTLGLVISLVLTAWSTPILAVGGGSSSFAILTVSQRQVGYMIVAASLVVAGLYLFFRRRRFHR